MSTDPFQQEHDAMLADLAGALDIEAGLALAIGDLDWAASQLPDLSGAVDLAAVKTDDDTIEAIRTDREPSRRDRLVEMLAAWRAEIYDEIRRAES